MKNENPWIRKEGKLIYENPWITLEDDEVVNPGGGLSQYGKVSFKNYAVGIIPLDEFGFTWLVGQWRYTLNAYSWEIPMGGGPKSEEILYSAKRELKEETGIGAEKWTEILRVHTSNSVTDELGIIYLAEDLSFGETEFEETEQIEVLKIPLNDAINWCDTGKITDAISVAGLFRIARLKGI